MVNSRHNYGINWGNRLKDNTIKNDEKVAINFWTLLMSTIAAFIGVQSNANRERDFKHGKVSHFIAIGILFGITFVLAIITVVKIVIASLDT